MPGTPHLIKVHSYAPVVSYQWKLDGVDLPGETKPYLYIDSIGEAHEGDYTVSMTNPNGTVETAASTLALVVPDQTIDFPAIPDKTFGDPDFDVSATATSGLPVEFSIVSGPATISGATVSITGAGTVVVRAEQPGDGDTGPAPAVEQSFVVEKLAAVVTLADLEHVYDGTPKSATVTTDPAGLNVVVTYAGDTTVPSSGGDYAVVAEIDEPNYSGVANGTLSIAAAPQTITFAPVGDQVFGVDPIALDATSDSGLDVEVVVVSGPASIDGSTLTVTGAGEVMLRASQAGDGNYLPAADVDQSFVVSKAAQTIDFPAIGTKVFGEAAFAPAATATSGLAVALEVLGGPATSDGTSLTLTGAGTVMVRASQAGDDSWLAADSVEQSFVVEKQPQVIDFAPLDDRVFDSGDVTLVATVGSGLDVQLEVVSGPATLAGSVLAMTGSGTITVRASQAGDDNFLAAEAVERSFIAGYSLALTPGAGGDVAATPAKPVYSPGETVSVSMSEDADFRFTGWGGDLSGLDSPTDLVMDNNKSVTAEFKHIWQLDVTSNAGGSVTIDPDKPEYLEGDVVTLTPVAESGYELAAWGGDASGTDDPLTVTMDADKAISAQFEDVSAPEITIFSPAAGVTNNQFSALFGTVADNDEVTSARWERNGVDQGDLELIAGGTFSVTGLVLEPGANTFRVFALDPAGNEGQGEVTIDWQPDRTLSLSDPPEVREGKLVTIPIELENIGNVGGMTFVVSYDETYLADPEVLLAGPVAAGINQINTDTPGEVRVTFALPATTLPAGSLGLGTVTFRARSVPFALTTQYDLEVSDVAGSDGNQIAFGTHTNGASGRILQRAFTGDINTNDKLDTGDAFLMQRMLAGLDEIRFWDNTLNDLNTSGLVDSGDVIRILRTVVGLDPQPGTPPPPPANKRANKGAQAGPSATMVASQSHGFDGDEITIQVMLEDIGYAPSGASFTLDYPAGALRLTDSSSHSAGALVPGDSLVLWNVLPLQDYANQSGSVSFVASSSAAWLGAEAGGVLAEFVFKVQPGASAQAFWPINLRQVEVPSENGFEILELPGSSIEFLGQPTTYDTWLEEHFDEAEIADVLITGPDADPDGDGRSNLDEYGMGTDPTARDAGAPVSVEVVAVEGGNSIAIGFDHSLTAIDLAYHVEISGDLTNWERNDGGDPVTELYSAELAGDQRTERLVVRDLELTDAAGSKFLRVGFELLTP